MLLNPKYAAESWRPGDECYFHEAHSDSIVRGEIAGIERVRGVATIRGETTPGTHERRLECLFHTHADGMAALCARNDARRRDYEASIETLEDLLQFALDHPVARVEEQTDWEARAAFIARARELLGVELRN